MEGVQVQVHPDCLKELVVGNTTFRSAMDFRLSDHDLEICRKELHETDAVRKASLHRLKEKLDSDEVFTYRTDDAYLLRYLRYRKFKCDDAHKHLRTLCKMRVEHPDLFHLPPDVEKACNCNVMTILPYLTEKGRIVIYFKASNWNLEETSVRDLMVSYSQMSTVVTMNPHVQINGIENFLDLGNMSLSHLTWLNNLNTLRLFAKLIQDLYPWRIKSAVLYNCNALLYAVFATIRFFLKKKVADRVVLLRSDLSELHKYFDPAILPKEYGGNLEDGQWETFLPRCMRDNVRCMEYESSFVGVKKKSSPNR